MNQNVYSCFNCGGCIAGSSWSLINPWKFCSGMVCVCVGGGGGGGGGGSHVGAPPKLIIACLILTIYSDIIYSLRNLLDNKLLLLHLALVLQ